MTFVRISFLGAFVLAAAGLPAGLFAALSAGPAAAAVLAAPAPDVPASRLILVDVPVDEMPPGMREAYIRGIQEELAAHGYKPGPADGVMGPRTRRAIRKYQRDAKLPVTGIATREILDHMKFVQPKVYAKPEVKPSGLVYDIQVKLRELGYYHGSLDGAVGPATREAARAFRYDAGLPVSGAIDEDLLARLTAAEPQTNPVEAYAQPEGADLPPGEAAEAPQPTESGPTEGWSDPNARQPLVAIPTPPVAE